MYATAYLLQLRDIGDTRIFDTPKFLWIVVRIRHQRRRWIDLPAVDTVDRAGGAKMGETAAILYPAKQER